MCSKKQLCKRLKRYAVKGLPKEQRHFFIDNKANILLIAHIDTVQQPRCDISNFIGAGFDDRLGVYIGLALVQKFPGMFDLLLTDYEETGRSTAKHFVPTHDYNFVVGLDREGDDFVDYGLASTEFLRDFKAVTSIKHNYGSFSDICSMDHIECSKVNLGIGVQSSHSQMSSFSPSIACDQVSRLLKFCEIYKDMHYKPGPGDRFSYYDVGYSCGHYTSHKWKSASMASPYSYVDPEFCDYCGNATLKNKLWEIRGFVVCDTCLKRAGGNAMTCTPLIGNC